MLQSQKFVDAGASGRGTPGGSGGGSGSGTPRGGGGPVGGSAGGSQSNLYSASQKYAGSVSSMHSLASVGLLPPGHGFVPRKWRPEKPYGPSYVSRVNRTHRGPGAAHLRRALVCACAAVLFITGASVYFGLRNVHRMQVLRTEVLGAALLVTGILLLAAALHFVHLARLASNQWRSNIRFKPDGLISVQPYNDVWCPDKIPKNLKTGTYGPKALREIPKPKPRQKGKKKKSGGAHGGDRLTSSADVIDRPATLHELPEDEGEDELPGYSTLPREEHSTVVKHAPNTGARATAGYRTDDPLSAGITTRYSRPSQYQPASVSKSVPSLQY